MGDETRLRFGSPHRRFPRTTSADASFQTWPRQVYPSRSRSHPPTSHPRAQAARQHPIVHRPARLAEAHRFQPQIPVWRRTPGQSQENECQEGQGRRRGLSGSRPRNSGGGRRRLSSRLSRHPGDRRRISVGKKARCLRFLTYMSWSFHFVKISLLIRITITIKKNRKHNLSYGKTLLPLLFFSS